MPELSQVCVYEDGQLLFSTDWSDALELGRQGEGERAPYYSTPQANCKRVVLAGRDEQGVSRKHAFLESLPNSRVRVTNKSTSMLIGLSNGEELQPQDSYEANLPLSLHLGPRTISIQVAGESHPVAELHSLDEAPEPPGSYAGNRGALATVAAASGSPADSFLLRSLQSAINVVKSAAESTEFLDRAAEALVETLGLDAGRVLMLDNGQWQVRAQKTAPNSDVANWRPSQFVLRNIREQKKTFWELPSIRAGSLQGVSGVIAAPILDHAKNVIGVLYGDRKQSDGQFDSGPIRQHEAMIVEILASGVATGLHRQRQEQAALQNERKLQIVKLDLEIGRIIQSDFLPKGLYQVPGWELDFRFRPARDVSGDFYDVFELPHSHVGLVIADVVNKGVGAALYMTSCRSLLRAFAQQATGNGLLNWTNGKNPGPGAAATGRRDTLLADLTTLAIVELTNNYMAQMHPVISATSGALVTTFFGVLNSNTGALAYVNAGHDPPVLINSIGSQKRLLPTGPILGMEPNIAYGIERITLEPGDALFAYTDGVTDARDPTGELFGEKRLLELLNGPVLSASALLDDVDAKLSQHIAGGDPYDDIAMLAVRRKT